MTTRMTKLALSLAAIVAAAPSTVWAQSAKPMGIVDDPCGVPVQAPPIIDRITEAMLVPQVITPEMIARVTGNPDLEAYSKAVKERAVGDWANLCRYAPDNARLAASHAPVRAVFLGDSITENWVKGDPGLFTDGVVGRGISGQTTPQMLLRFHADVVALNPKVVHILAGANDIAGNTGPSTVQTYKNNIIAMVEMARANRIKVVLASILPAARIPWQPTIDPAGRVVELNKWLESYARKNGLTFVNYYPVLADANGGLPSRFSNDGVHPNRNGYSAMHALAEAATPRGD